MDETILKHLLDWSYNEESALMLIQVKGILRDHVLFSRLLQFLTSKMLRAIM